MYHSRHYAIFIHHRGLPMSLLSALRAAQMTGHIVTSSNIIMPRGGQQGLHPAELGGKVSEIKYQKFNELNLIV